MEKKSKVILNIFLVLSFLGMITTNILADLLPINGVTTAQVSDQYVTLFTPAGFTFAIWGVIYLLQAVYVLYSLGVFKKSCVSNTALNLTNSFVIMLNLLNIGWIIAWHFRLMFVSVLIIILMLVVLIVITNSNKKQNITGICKLFVNVPFLVYLAWITVATIANISSLLVSINWNGFGLAPSTWTVIIISVATLISAITAIYYNCMFYVATILWAFTGILVKHLVTYDFAYPDIVYTLIVALFIMLLCTVPIIYTSVKAKKK